MSSENGTAKLVEQTSKITEILSNSNLEWFFVVRNTESGIYSNSNMSGKRLDELLLDVVRLRERVRAVVPDK